MTGLSPEEVGQAIRARRRELHISQDELARRVGVSKFTIHNLETGRYAKPSSLPRVLEVLGMVTSDPAALDRLIDALAEIWALPVTKEDKKAMSRALIEVYIEQHCPPSGALNAG
jgi:predicted transcriptional regulator